MNATTHHDPALDSYVSPLAQRNASREMQEVWSPRHRYTLWRKVWLAVAEAQMDAALPITREQTGAIRAHVNITEEDIKRAFQHEEKLKHDVMAHVHALGDAVPVARGIPHLGKTSQDVVCNADILLFR